MVLSDYSHDYWDLFEYIVSILSSSEVCLMVMIMWGIWGASEPHILCARAQGILKSFAKNTVTSVKC